MINKVNVCGVDTSKLPTLTQAQSDALFRLVKTGDRAAREEFIYSNLRLVLSIIQRFSNRQEQSDDLFQVGCVGLIKAMDNFDTNYNVRFSTYAVPMIIGEIRRYLRDNSAIRVSRSLRDTAYRALSAKAELTSENMDEPDAAQIAKRMEITEREVIYALDAISEPLSLFEPIYNDSGDAVYIMDQVSDDKQSEEGWSDRLALTIGIDRLPAREKKIIEMRFFDGRTQTEVASEIGISQAQVSRLEKSALRSMRKFV